MKFKTNSRSVIENEVRCHVVPRLKRSGLASPWRPGQGGGSALRLGDQHEEGTTGQSRREHTSSSEA